MGCCRLSPPKWFPNLSHLYQSNILEFCILLIIDNMFWVPHTGWKWKTTHPYLGKLCFLIYCSTYASEILISQLLFNQHHRMCTFGTGQPNWHKRAKVRHRPALAWLYTLYFSVHVFGRHVKCSCHTQKNTSAMVATWWLFPKIETIFKGQSYLET